MKVKELIKLAEAEGWEFVRQKGSHRHYRHEDSPMLLTIAGKLSTDMAKGTERRILKIIYME